MKKISKFLLLTLSDCFVFSMIFFFMNVVSKGDSFLMLTTTVLAEEVESCEDFIDSLEENSTTLEEDLTPMPLFSSGEIPIPDGNLPTDGKSVAHSNIISDMPYFPEHDGMNGCGMVAMGLLLQYYNELPTQKQYDFIPSQYYYGDSSILPCTTTACNECKQCRANAFRDYLTAITPTIGDITLGVAQNATFPLQHYEGFNNYFQENCESINPNIVYRSWESNMGQDIIELIDQNIPVLVTVPWLTYLNGETGCSEPHVVVVYGYNFIDGNYVFKVHTGWQGVCSQEVFIDYLIGYCYFKDNELDCFEDETIGSNQTAITKLFYSYDNTVTIPEFINKKEVVKINERAFEDQTNVHYVNFSSSVQEIGDEAFYNTGVYVAKVPETVTVMGQGVFKNCISLNRVEFGANITKIEPYTFYGCRSLRGVNFPSFITEIGDGAFEGANLRDVMIPTSIQKIGDNAFLGIDEPTLYVEFRNTTPAEWEDSWNNGCDVFWNCTFSLEKDYVVSFVKSNMINVGYTGTYSPTREGCSFAGWYTSDNYIEYGYTSLDIYVAQDDVIYFAKWNGYSVIIEYKNVGDTEFNGTHSDGYPTTHVNATNTVLGTATRSGFTFLGWFDNPDGLGVAITTLCADDSYSGVIILYAKWKAYSGGGGIFTPIYKDYSVDTEEPLKETKYNLEEY